MEKKTKKHVFVNSFVESFQADYAKDKCEIVMPEGLPDVQAKHCWSLCVKDIESTADAMLFGFREGKRYYEQFKAKYSI